MQSPPTVGLATGKKQPLKHEKHRHSRFAGIHKHAELLHTERRHLEGKTTQGREEVLAKLATAQRILPPTVMVSVMHQVARATAPS